MMYKGQKGRKEGRKEGRQEGRQEEAKTRGAQLTEWGLEWGEWGLVLVASNNHTTKGGISLSLKKVRLFFILECSLYLFDVVLVFCRDLTVLFLVWMSYRYFGW